jgi:hypothetical protein
VTDSTFKPGDEVRFTRGNLTGTRGKVLRVDGSGIPYEVEYEWPATTKTWAQAVDLELFAVSTPTVKVDLEDLERVIKQALPMTMRNESPCEARVALRALIAEVRASRAGGWVACSERMPEFGVAVLIRREACGDPELARLNGEGAQAYCWLPDNTCEERALSDVTMWHPLPSPPRSEP